MTNNCAQTTQQICTQINQGRVFISYWTDDFNHSQLIRADTRYLIILLYPVEDLILNIMLFLLANLFFHQLLDIHTVRKKKLLRSLDLKYP